MINIMSVTSWFCFRLFFKSEEQKKSSPKMKILSCVPQTKLSDGFRRL